MDKQGSFKLIFLVMILSILIASLWDSVPIIKDSVHAVLDPSAGLLLNWNITWGMTIIILIINLITTILQKYTTDQKTLKELKDEQKILQEEMKKYKENPSKIMELQKKQMEFLPKTMKLTMRPIIFTGVPFVLFFRWFMDYFALTPNFKFFGFLSWFWFYLIGSIIFSSILRKVFKVY